MRPPGGLNRNPASAGLEALVKRFATTLILALTANLMLLAASAHAQDDYEIHYELSPVDMMNDLIAQGVRQKDSMKLKMVTRFFNMVPVRSDETVWGQVDYWAMPEELLLAGYGDDEDFAIAKYVALQRMGFPKHLLSLAVVHNSLAEASYVALLVYSGESSEPIVLDYVNYKIQTLDRRPELTLIKTLDDSLIGDHRAGQQVAAGRFSSRSLAAPRATRVARTWVF